MIPTEFVLKARRNEVEVEDLLAVVDWAANPKQLPFALGLLEELGGTAAVSTEAKLREFLHSILDWDKRTNRAYANALYALRSLGNEHEGTTLVQSLELDSASQV